MFELTVRDHVMIAHSLPHPAFGPAQNLHGATFVVELTLWRATLGPEAVVLDIGVAAGVLADILAGLNYRNLDDHPAFAGRLSTTEVVALHIAEAAAEQFVEQHLLRLRVLLREHPDAWAAYTMELG